MNLNAIRMRRPGVHWLGCLALGVLLGCVQVAPPRGAAPARVRPTATPQGAHLYLYPAQGQSAERQDRDRYECYRWAVRQTGFDPSAMPDTLENRLTIVRVPPRGMETVASTLFGAALGASLGAISGHAGEGAVIGATAGAITGASREAAREQAIGEIEAREEAARRAAERNDRARYHRALSACLEGRGYTVR